ncbi:helix-turn-helix domain-containing protein [Salmonella enterica subsp. enterica serovar Newport]|nr:helix-turn-helix domain-containing protein [Salmonella enterica subsp. enterica serovar Newport]
MRVFRMLHIDKLESLEVYASQLELLRRLSAQSPLHDRLTLDSLMIEISNVAKKILLEILVNLNTPPSPQPAAPTGYTPNNIGNRIQIARENLGMSLDDLAASVLPDDVEVVSEWENGKSEPCASEIIRLSQALKCDPMWLLTGKECAK